MCPTSSKTILSVPPTTMITCKLNIFFSHLASIYIWMWDNKSKSFRANINQQYTYQQNKNDKYSIAVRSQLSTVQLYNHHNVKIAFSQLYNQQRQWVTNRGKWLAITDTELTKNCNQYKSDQQATICLYNMHNLSICSSIGVRWNIFFVLNIRADCLTGWLSCPHVC